MQGQIPAHVRVPDDQIQVAGPDVPFERAQQDAPGFQFAGRGGLTRRFAQDFRTEKNRNVRSFGTNRGRAVGPRRREQRHQIAWIGFGRRVLDLSDVERRNGLGRPPACGSSWARIRQR